MKRVAVTFRNPRKAIPYETALRAVGLEPVAVTPEAPCSLDGFDGLVITGGTDLDPALYGQERHPECEEPDRERDALEAGLIREALDRGLPMLGICRGLQMLNVVQGGTLHQHLDNTAMHTVRPPEAEQYRPAHSISVEPGTQLSAAIGAAAHEVNSRHHQAVDRLGRGLVVSARAPDGTVEGLEVPDKRFAVAVQWHPEDSVGAGEDELNRRLFEAFAQAVNGR
jgi:putative glutamine amidotransferase